MVARKLGEVYLGLQFKESVELNSSERRIGDLTE